MDLRRCILVGGAILASALVGWAVGIFEPAALAPSRIIAGSTRSLIAIAVVLVSAMTFVSTCRREPEERPVAKTGSGARNKTTA